MTFAAAERAYLAAPNDHECSCADVKCCLCADVDAQAKEDAAPAPDFEEES